MKKEGRFTPRAILLFCLLITTIFLCGRNNEKEEKNTDTDTADTKNYTWSAPPLPAAMDFAGEKVPLERWEIREQFDRELLINYYWQGSILYILKLSERYFPMIEQRLQANGVPDDMKYLCIAESKLQNQVSRAGAAGFWQFMPGTAPAFGLEVNNEVDERYHLAKSTDAACQYLKQAYAKLGSWTAAAASYNCGQGGYNGHATYQRTNNYYDLLLAEETNHYIFRILTFKYLLSASKKLGFLLPPAEGYPQITMRSIGVTKSIPNLAAFAIEQGSTYKMLKLCNPWLRARTLTLKAGKTYTILLPDRQG